MRGVSSKQDVYPAAEHVRPCGRWPPFYPQALQRQEPKFHLRRLGRIPSAVVSANRSTRSKRRHARGRFRELCTVGFTKRVCNDPKGQIYDPFTTTFNGASNTYSRAPFLDNIIPADRISPISQAFQNLIPHAGTLANGSNLFVPGRSATNQDSGTIRGDQYIGNSDQSRSPIAIPLGSTSSIRTLSESAFGASPDTTTLREKPIHSALPRLWAHTSPVTRA